MEVEFDAQPERIFAMNLTAIENLIELGVEDRIVGAVGDLDRLREDLQPKAEEIDVIDPGGEDYPSSEVILETEPDFIYAVYPSAFREDGGVASREELHDLGVQSYLSPGRCPDRDDEQPLEFDETWSEMREVGSLLGAEDQAEEIVDEQQEALAAVRADLPDDVGDLDVFWWDMGTGDGPTAGGCCGAPGMILRELGVNNLFDDLPGHCPIPAGSRSSSGTPTSSSSPTSVRRTSTTSFRSSRTTRHCVSCGRSVRTRSSCCLSRRPPRGCRTSPPSRRSASTSPTVPTDESLLPPKGPAPHGRATR